MAVNMGLKMILMAFLAMYEVETSAVMTNSERNKPGSNSSKCAKEFYFDPNLGEDGRCQPCDEICNPINPMDENQCEKNMDQCSETYRKYHSTIEPSPGPNTSTNIVIVTAVSVVVAVVMITLLGAYLYVNRQSHCQNCHRGHCHVVKPVNASSHHSSKEEICINGVNKDSLDSSSRALLNSAVSKQFNAIRHNEGVVTV